MADATDDDTHLRGSTAAVSAAASSSDAVGKALSSMLSSVITDFDQKADCAAQSQVQLSLAVDRLTGELDRLLEDAPLPYLMQHASKISGVRKRVMSLNILLKSIQRRLDNVDRALSVGLAHEPPKVHDNISK